MRNKSEFDRFKGMNTQTQKNAGILLIILGAFLYGHTVFFYPYFSHRNDFTHLYIAGYLADHGRNIFDIDLTFSVKEGLGIQRGINPFVYPPFFALLLIPLSRYSYDSAWTLFYLSSHLVYFIALALLVKMLTEEEEPQIMWWGILLALSAVFSPLAQTFAAGQMNTFLLLILVASLYHFKKQSHITAGAIIGFGTAIKISPFLFIFYFLWKRKWAAATAAITVLILSLILSLFWLGWNVHSEFIQIASQMGYGTSTWSQFGQHYHVEPHNQAPSAFWYRLLTHNPTTTGILHAPLLAKIFSYVTAIVIMGLLFLYTRSEKNSSSEWEYSIWIIGMLLIPSLLWDHYFVQALFPIALAIRIGLNQNKRGIYLLAFGLAFMAMPFIYETQRFLDSRFSTLFSFFLYDYPPFKTGWKTVFLSLKLFGLLFLFGYILLHRPKEEPQSDDSIFPEVFNSFNFK